MPIIFHKKEVDFNLGIWRIDEEPETLLQKGSLSSNDVERVHSFQSIARKKEWICARLLLSEMMPGMNLSIEYDANGKPHLQNVKSETEIFSFHISVSHTKNFVGLIISEKYPASIDVELIHPRIEKIVHRFVYEDELKFIPSSNRLEHYYLIWSVKECLYKMHGRGELLFKEHLHVHPFHLSKDGEITASLKKGELEQEIKFLYSFKNDLLIVYGLDKA
jgi:4'-phosphopantetheinyl transferase